MDNKSTEVPEPDFSKEEIPKEIRLIKTLEVVLEHFHLLNHYFSSQASKNG